MKMCLQKGLNIAAVIGIRIYSGRLIMNKTGCVVLGGRFDLTVAPAVAGNRFKMSFSSLRSNIDDLLFVLPPLTDEEHGGERKLALPLSITPSMHRTNTRAQLVYIRYRVIMQGFSNISDTPLILMPS
ncbi:hypothetical protein TbgDal_IX3590 [Trypanosoma brucei gambiense DAL972]|uniref:Uncharacterized protein n=1 Tax=Trypanosoma brucei gambiense (strain MHOM/CI/86/DAL972) TaxID=679716 RepID=C9ZXY9_TRYB9|nr:hypothetical protein TbgDal_IX3590 [Trypanosoma brucei gambiense DAL972]CBH14284.1 hypothetical protein TbgDal_IX3590 [Trypanosoma brucei gambiense DAL972]|eukprot:XP_011776554.1 hypothetical protein TbgDal_IX3590 [Trypanosoma brucei gambiense DAL972]